MSKEQSDNTGRILSWAELVPGKTSREMVTEVVNAGSLLLARLYQGEPVDPMINDVLQKQRLDQPLTSLREMLVASCFTTANLAVARQLVAEGKGKLQPNGGYLVDIGPEEAKRVSEETVRQIELFIAQLATTWKISGRG